MNGNRVYGRRKIGIAAVMTVIVAAFGILGISAQSRIDEMLRVAFIGTTNTANSSEGLLYQAAVLAAEEINEDDGVIASDGTNYGFEIVFYQADTQSEVLEAYDEALSDDAVAILGPDDPTLAQAISDAGTPDVPVLLGNASADDGTSIYLLSASTESLAEAGADYLANIRAFDQIALLTVDTDAGTAAREAVMGILADDAVVSDITFDADRSEFESEADTIREAEADALFVWARDDQMEALLQALDDTRWNGVIVFGGGDGAFLEDIDSSQVFTLKAWSTSAYDSDSQAFVEAYTQRWQAEPDAASAAYYDAVYLLASAVDANGATVSSITSGLNRSTEIDGVQGDYVSGQTDGVRLMNWQDGVYLEAAQYADGECLTCPDTFLADSSAEDVSETATFSIGLITAVNGDNEALGESIEDAVSLAIREINDHGGAVDPSDTRYVFSLNVYHATTAEEAEAALSEAAEDGVQVVLGPDYNGQVMPNLNAAENASVLQFVSATNGQIAQTEADDYVFQMRATDESLAAAAARYLTDTRGLTRFVTVAVNTDYGRDGIDAFEDGVNDSDDGEVVLNLEHEVDELDMTILADRIVSANAQAVVVWSSEPGAAALLAALDATGWDGLFVYGYLTPNFVSENVYDGIEIVGPVNWWSSAESWASRDFSTRFADRYNQEPLPQSAAYYDTVYLVREAISENGAETSDIQDWMLQTESYIGAQGEYTPDAGAGGELTQSVLIVQAVDGVVSEVSRYVGETCVAWCE
ncbi:MAG: ABC transporter substrate-binding protein [bacterium]|nr:ABC transporter substrate-binding protein [bacterium]